MKKLLMVEDEISFFTSLIDHLRAIGWDVVTAQSVDEACSAAKASGPFQVMVLDILLPRSKGEALNVANGIEFLRSIRQREHRPYLPASIPVLAMTAVAQERALAAASELDALVRLKGTDLADLVQDLESLAGRRTG